MESIEEEKSYSKWEWFLYILLLPTLFTLILVGIILTFMKVDVITPILEVGNKIPYIEKIIPDPKIKPDDEFVLYENTFKNQKGEAQTSDAAVQKAAEEEARYQKEISDKESLILELERDLSVTESRIEELEAELIKLSEAADETANSEQRQKNKEIAQMYGAMTPSKSAPILSSLDNNEAVQILAEMDSKKMSQILAKMDPQKAADLTLLLKDVGNKGITSDQVLQQRIDQLVKELEEVKANKSGTEAGMLETVKSFEAMDPTAAAGIFEKMWTDGNKKQALAILKRIGTQSLSGILAKMKPETAALITSDLAN